VAVVVAVMRLAHRHRPHDPPRHLLSAQRLHPSRRPAVLTTWTTTFLFEPDQMSIFEPTAPVPWAFLMAS